MSSLLAQSAFNWGYLLTVGMVLFFLIACILLILTVLIQKPQGGGLAGAFGSGAGSGQTAFGTRTGDALTVATIIMFTLYLGGAIGLTFLIRPGIAQPTSIITAPASDTTPAPATPAPAGPEPQTPAPTAAPAPATGTGSPPAVDPATAPAETPKPPSP